MAQARFQVNGRVQGVGFRAWARSQALALNLHGSACNRSDGDVEVIASGEAEALDTFGRLLWQGPSLAQVSRVDRTGWTDEVATGFVTG
ncbi:MAG TPA: acylphosphatase [Stenotrophomonas sp.]|jgi:acylphosphatase